MAFDKFISPDFVGGRERFKGMILGFRRAFPDLKLELRDIFGAGDKVVSSLDHHRHASRPVPRHRPDEPSRQR